MWRSSSLAGLKALEAKLKQILVQSRERLTTMPIAVQQALDHHPLRWLNPHARRIARSTWMCSIVIGWSLHGSKTPARTFI